MAITRRQFVTRLGTLAAAMGVSQVDLAKVAEAFAHQSAVWPGAWTNKPKVVWVHGAECTGCSTSLLSLFEDVRGKALETVGSNIAPGLTNKTVTALDLAVGGDGDGTTVLPPSLGGNVDGNHPYGHRTLYSTNSVAGCDFDGQKNSTPYIANIADVLIDFIDLQYHETVMGMGGDLAYKWLKDIIDSPTGGSAPFVLVVEGSIQPKTEGGYFNETGAAPWCSIGMGETAGEHSFDDVVLSLSKKSQCLAVIPIGQCACFGGYPACVSPTLEKGMTGALGTEDFLKTYDPDVNKAASKKVIAVPGCPTNPWWFVLTVVAFLADASQGGLSGAGPLGILNAGAINASAVDSSRRLKAVYGVPLHGPYCTRYQDAVNGIYAEKPGDPGCLQLIGCKGPQVMTLCGPHGWNGINPHNDSSFDYGISGVHNGRGGNCVAAGHPCMACTEKGYPDAFLPFVIR